VREALTLLALGLLALVVESALLAILPDALVPSFALLLPVAAALLLPPATGLLVSVALGFGADMLSGALFGLHAFVRLLEFAAVRLLASQLDLVRPLPFAIFALGVALLDAASVAGVARFFLSEFGASRDELARVGLRALATAVAAPLALVAARVATSWGSLEEARREMRLDTKRPVI
jgi:rod shape-determining protein MreD